MGLSVLGDHDNGESEDPGINHFCLVREEMSSHPAYQYEFIRELPGEGDPGAYHSSELWYIFHTLDRSWRPFSEADYALSKEMVGTWTSFCKTGNPGWDSYTRNHPYIKYFNIK